MLRKNQATIKHAKAIELFEEGVACKDVAERLGVTLTTCRRWLSKWKKPGKGESKHGKSRS